MFFDSSFIVFFVTSGIFVNNSKKKYGGIFVNIDAVAFL
jgi:hypothetical protein